MFGRGIAKATAQSTTTAGKSYTQNRLKWPLPGGVVVFLVFGSVYDLRTYGEVASAPGSARLAVRPSAKEH